MGFPKQELLEWVAIPFSRGSSQPRDWTWVFCTAGRFFTVWATREAQGPSGEGNKGGSQVQDSWATTILRREGARLFAYGHILWLSLTVPSLKLLPKSWSHKGKLHLPWPVSRHSWSLSCLLGAPVSWHLSLPSPPHLCTFPFPSLWGCHPACQALLCCFSCARALISLGGCTHSRALQKWRSHPSLSGRGRSYLKAAPTLRETKQEGSSLLGYRWRNWVMEASCQAFPTPPWLSEVTIPRSPTHKLWDLRQVLCPVLYHRHGTCWCHKFRPGLISDSSGIPPLRPCYVESWPRNRWQIKAVWLKIIQMVLYTCERNKATRCVCLCVCPF